MVNDMVNDKTILVGVDGSHASYKATWWAANYAKHVGLSLQIVCAYSLPSYAAVSFDATYTAMGDDNAAHADAQEILSKAKAIADEQGVDAQTLIVTGDPSSVFVELSRNYNLIVIGNRGKGGLAERLLGTTSSSLPAYAYCPIVVVPYTDDKGNLMHLNNVITRVAVGSDDTKWGIRALQLAADFTNSWGAELDVITVVPSNTNLEDADVRHQFEEALDERLAPIAAKYPDLKIRKTIVAGNAVETLTRASRDHDMVVVARAAVVDSPACCSTPRARDCCSIPSRRSMWCRASSWKPRPRAPKRCRPRPCRPRRSTNWSRRCRSTAPAKTWNVRSRATSTRRPPPTATAATTDAPGAPARSH